MWNSQGLQMPVPRILQCRKLYCVYRSVKLYTGFIIDCRSTDIRISGFADLFVNIFAAAILSGELTYQTLYDYDMYVD